MSLIKNIGYSIFSPFIITFLGVFHLGLPIIIDFILSLIIAYFLRSRGSAFTTSITLITLFVIINSLYDAKIYYRPHEMLSSDNNKYEPNVEIKMHQEFGDLFVMGKMSADLLDIIEPREIRFVTDERGYRNEKLFLKPEIILVGDSFIVGNGNSQEDILSNQLAKFSDRDVYSVAFPGEAADYENYLNDNLDLLDDQKNILLFYFEGNDFQEIRERDFVSVTSRVKSIVVKLEGVKTYYLSLLYPKNFKLVRIINRKSLSFYSFMAKLFLGADNKYVTSVEKKLIGRQSVGFLKSYIRVTKATNVQTYIWRNPELLERLKAVVFIPTKYRVYNEINTNVPLALLNSSYAPKNINVIDLTPALKKSAQNLLENQGYVFWRDDTHWNPTGIKVSAKFLTNKLDMKK